MSHEVQLCGTCCRDKTLQECDVPSCALLCNARSCNGINISANHKPCNMSPRVRAPSRRGENRSRRRKTSRSKDENQQQTQPTYDAETGNRTQATLVGRECSHQWCHPCTSLLCLIFLFRFRYRDGRAG